MLPKHIRKWCREQDAQWFSKPHLKFNLVLRAYEAFNETPPASVRRKALSPPARAKKRKRPERPQSHFCPISSEIMHDPVIAPDGHSYDRVHLVKWLSIKRTSPMTQQIIPLGTALPRNHALRQAIEDFE